MPGHGNHIGTAEDRDRAGLGGVPPSIAKQGAREWVRAREPTQGFGCAQGVQRFGGLPLLFFLGPARRQMGDLLDQRSIQVV